MERAMTAQDAATNLLRIPLGGRPGRTARSSVAIIAELARFGDIICIDVQQGEVRVSYHDVRAAINAKAYFGSGCVYGPQRGLRSLRLLGCAIIESMDAAGISNVCQTEDGDYFVEFYDIRKRASAAVAAYTMPAIVTPTAFYGAAATGKVEGDTGKVEGSQHMLWLRGVPAALCERCAMEALLQAHGFEACVDSVKVSMSKLAAAGGGRGRTDMMTSATRPPLGGAVIHASSPEALAKLRKFFHGRALPGSRTPVAVSLTPPSRVDLSALPSKASSAQRARDEIDASTGMASSDSSEATCPSHDASWASRGRRAAPGLSLRPPPGFD